MSSRSITVPLTLVTICTLSCAALFGIAQVRTGAPAHAATTLDASRRIGPAATYRNLAVYPVYDSRAAHSTACLTLDEGLRSHKVVVKESAGGGSVNTLFVTNRSTKPVYLMAGEVVLGGQQDRTLARDTIIAPGRKSVPVTVFCVEHGRWSGRSEFGQTAPTVAASSIRSKAIAGEFKASLVAKAAATAPAASMRGQSSQAGSRANVEIDVAANDISAAQQQVWDGVADKNRILHISNGTGTYRDALTMRGGAARQTVPAYYNALANRLGADPHLVGVVAAVNGRVIAADVFSDPALFRKLWPKLLRSYAADAVELAGARKPGSGARRASESQVRQFLSAARTGGAKEVSASGPDQMEHYESREASVYSLKAAAKPGTSDDRPLHETIIRK